MENETTWTTRRLSSSPVTKKRTLMEHYLKPDQDSRCNDITKNIYATDIPDTNASLMRSHDKKA